MSEAAERAGSPVMDNKKTGTFMSSERFPFPEVLTGRLQLVWYGWPHLWRLFIERPFYPGVYRWRVAVGPLDIRRWESHND